MDSRSTNADNPGPPSAPVPAPRAELSDREREILVLVATGASNKLIAQQLVISPNTVKVHLRNIFAKINVASRTEAALFAIREGLVQVNGEAPVVAAEDDLLAAPAASLPDVVPGEIPVVVPQPPVVGRATPWALWIAFGLVAIALVGAGLWASTNRPPAATPLAPTAIPRWSRQADLPTARAGLAVAAYGNEIFAIAGETANGISGIVELFDTATNAWVTLTPKPTPVTDVSAAIIGGQIYVPGGRLASGAMSNVLEVYQPDENRWEARAGLPTAVSGYALAAFEGQLYLFGGWDGEHYLDQALVYDPGRDTWRKLTALPTARAFGGAAAAGGLIYVIGGEDSTGPVAVNEVFMPAREAQGQAPWETRQPLPEARSALGLTSLADSVYAVGGRGATARFAAWSYQTAQDAWLPLDLPEVADTSHLGLAAMQTRLYALGGRQGALPSGQQLVYQAIYTTIFPGVSGQ
jgi:DNA-binding CsgD family transcriptional regulator